MIRLISAAETHGLRHRVLRPHQDISAMSWLGDESPQCFHFGFINNDMIVGIATIFKNPIQNSSQKISVNPTGLGFQLRGMATSPEIREKGIGRKLIEACVAKAQENDASYIWCDARVSALGFYQKMGFQIVSAEFVKPEAGPHFVMLREI